MLRVLNPPGFDSAGTEYRITQFPLPRGSVLPIAISVDRKTGDIWFVEQGSNQIGMLGPDGGKITEYPIPTPNSMATSVAIDSRDNVWFSELGSNRIGEIKNGTINEYIVPPSSVEIEGISTPEDCGPSQLAIDRFDNVWIACVFSNQIDEFFQNNGTFDSFNLPVFQSAPAGFVFDDSGNLWFTAADANMLGRAEVSSLRNGTSSGITEFAPLNRTYIFNFQKESNYFGSVSTVRSSLPTPTGIAISPDGNTLWISEHVDNSFDSYNLKTQSLDRYWTSKTFDEYGYPVSLPNGLAIDTNGTVWIAEHYGNKIAEFNPPTDHLTEFIVSCCNTTIAGVYTLTLGNNGSVWFVESLANAIGELLPSSPTYPIVSVAPNQEEVVEGSPGEARIPIVLQQTFDPNLNQNVSVSLDVSGVSSNGTLTGATGYFDPDALTISGDQGSTSYLELKVESLAAGTYDLTMSAELPAYGVIFSTILKIEISHSSGLPLTEIAIIVAIATIAIFVSYKAVRRS